MTTMTFMHISLNICMALIDVRAVYVSCIAPWYSLWGYVYKSSIRSFLQLLQIPAINVSWPSDAIWRQRFVDFSLVRFVWIYLRAISKRVPKLPSWIMFLKIMLLKLLHCSGGIISAMASQITGVSIVYSTVCSGAEQRKHQSSASLAFVRGIHRSPMNSPHKGPVTRENVSIWWRHHVPHPKGPVSWKS